MRTVAQRFRTALQDGDFEAIERLFTAEALLDANVPFWRLQRRGAVAIRRQMEEWLPEGPARFVEWHERPADWGYVVECAECKLEGSEDVYYRQVFLFVTEGDRIANFTFYCTGAWDAEAFARHARDTPIVC